RLNASDCKSPFYTVKGQAPIAASAWALPAGSIDVLHPTPAEGIGAMMVTCGAGLTDSWTGLRGGELILGAPALMVEPGRIAITDLNSHNVFCAQTFRLWKDERNPFGTTVEVRYSQPTPLFYNSLTSGVEMVSAVADADAQIDRPVDITGEP